MRVHVFKAFAASALAVVSLAAVAQTVKTQITFSQPIAGIAADPITNRIYVVAPSFGGTTDTLAVINSSTDAIVQNIPVPVGAYLPAVNIVTNRIYVASCNYNEDPTPCFVTVVDGKKGKVLTQIPVTTTSGNGIQGITVDPVTDKIYVANGNDDVIDVINGATNKITGTLGVSGGSPYGLAINPFNHRLYVPLASDALEVIDVCKRTVIATTTFGGNTSFAAVNWATGNVFVTDSVFGPSTTGVFDKNGAVLAAVPVGDTPYGVDVDPVTNLAFVASTGLNNITVIDGSSNTVKATVSGVPANFVAVNFVAAKAYVAGDNVVTVLTEK
jgi:YVTN family beta-propeller protein